MLLNGKARIFAGVTGPAVLLDLAEEAKRAMVIFGGAMNIFGFTYGADFRDVEDPHQLSGREELAVSVDFLLCKPPRNLSC